MGQVNAVGTTSIEGSYFQQILRPVSEVLYLVGVESPEVEFLLEQRSADVGRIVQLPGAVVVEDLREDARVSVEEVLVEDGIVVGQRLRQPAQPRRWDLLQRRLVRLVADDITLRPR